MTDGPKSHSNLLLRNPRKRRSQRQRICPVTSTGVMTVPQSKRPSWSGKLRPLMQSRSTPNAPALSASRKHGLANDTWEVFPRQQKDAMPLFRSSWTAGVPIPCGSKSPTSCASLDRTKNQSVSFSRAPDALIQGYTKTPADLENSWSDTDVPRILKNQTHICKVQGMSVSYPADIAQALHRQRKTFITRIESVDVNDVLTQKRRMHMQMVLAEQQRQRQAGEVDAEELGKVSAKYSARNIEIANSSWWLDRFKYR